MILQAFQSSIYVLYDMLPASSTVNALYFGVLLLIMHLTHLITKA